MALFFLYPFAYGLVLSFRPQDGQLGRQLCRPSSPTPISTTRSRRRCTLAVPVTVLSLVLAVPIAFRVRLMRRQRLLTTILVIPITLGTVLVAEGLLNYLGPQGWFNRTLLALASRSTTRSG